MNNEAFELGEEIRLKTLEFKLHQDLWDTFNIGERENESNHSKIIKKLSKINMSMDSAPWTNVMWNSNENKMIMNSTALTRLLNAKELNKVKEGYASKKSIPESDVFTELDNI